MPFLKSTCPTCGKTAISKREFLIGGKTALLLECGHVIAQSQLHSSGPESIISLDGKKPYKFQEEGIKFLEAASGRALIADEMGLGKTIQALGFLALHPELCPFVAVVKKSLTVQWQHETLRWLGEDALTQIIDTPKMMILPGLKGYIISYDLLRRFVKKEEFKTPSGSTITKEVSSLLDKFGAVAPKTLILDECQQIKNTDSSRAQQVRDLSKQFECIIALSGTPIKNNASEYFSILNILKPELFPVKAKFEQNWCDSYFSGGRWKSGGIRDAELFQERTKHFIIRRERSEVMPDLPRITRNFSFSDLSEAVQAAYDKTFAEFENEYNSESEGFARDANILAYMTKMRHLTGLSKIDPTIDHVMEFLGSTDRKLTIFVHHKDVAQILFMKLKNLLSELGLADPLMLTSELSGQGRSDLVEKFKMDVRSRICIASTLAAGEGLNMQFCSDCIMMERQWNPANEEQAEGRFIRIGQLMSCVTGTYMVAVGTIDEFFGQLVERKREIVNRTLGGESVTWDQSSLMKELAEVLIAKGRRAWSLK